MYYIFIFICVYFIMGGEKKLNITFKSIIEIYMYITFSVLGCMRQTEILIHELRKKRRKYSFSKTKFK